MILMSSRPFLSRCVALSRVASRNQTGTNLSGRVRWTPPKSPFSISTSRFQSTAAVAPGVVGSGSSVSDVIDISNTAGEVTLAQIAEKLSTDLQIVSGDVPTLADYGLGSMYTPVGWMQNLMITLEETVGLPWWASIVMTTVTIRTLLFPLIIKSRKYMIAMNNNAPEFQRIQKSMTDAKVMGNALGAATAANDLQVLMREKKVGPFDAFLPMAQAPIFITFYLALSKMANAPVESMKTGGTLWFPDLTLVDPYYALPFLTSLTMAVTIELGVDGVRPDSLKLMRYVMRALPWVIFPFIMNFPTAVLCYWFATNSFSLFQVGILKVPMVKKYFNLPDLIPRPKPTTSAGGKTPFIQEIKESMRNMQIQSRNEDKSRSDEIRFRQAGLGPVPRTYKRPPNAVKK